MNILGPMFRRAEPFIFRFHLFVIRAGLQSSHVFAWTIRGLAARKRLAEADHLFQRASVLFPNSPGLYIAHARSAQTNGLYNEAKTRWTAVRDKWPDLAEAWHQIAANARVLNKRDEASAVIKEACELFPGDMNVLIEAARVADHCGFNAEALVLWERVIKDMPPAQEFLISYANNLLKLGRFDEAEKAIDAASNHFPEAPAVLAMQGSLAMGREDWDGAIAIWQNFRSRYPDDMAGWEQLGQTLTSKQLAEAEKGMKPAPVLTAPVEIARVEDEAIRTLLLGFESIGTDCEFGMVQRRYGAEPLGLLRWNYVPLTSLIAALDSQFEGMGDPEHTELWLSSPGEYFIRDKRWGLGMHTFMFEHQIDREVFLPKICKRVSYLREKFLTDLSAAEKTLVFKADDFDLETIAGLHERFQKLGDVRLLCVKPVKPGSADEASGTKPIQGKPGDVFKIADKRYIGFISRPGGIQGYWDIAFDEWVSICQNVGTAPTLDAVA